MYFLPNDLGIACIECSCLIFLFCCFLRSFYRTLSIDKIRENGFELTKKRSRRYPAKTITDAGYADDIAILANTPNQAETLLNSLERAAAGIGLYVNAHKIEYMRYNNQTWCPWCNGYRRRNWTRRHEFESWTRQCISHSTNTLGKGMNPIILPPAMGK